MSKYGGVGLGSRPIHGPFMRPSLMKNLFSFMALLLFSLKSNSALWWQQGLVAAADRRSAENTSKACSAHFNHQSILHVKIYLRETSSSYLTTADTTLWLRHKIMLLIDKNTLFDSVFFLFVWSCWTFNGAKWKNLLQNGFNRTPACCLGNP